MRTRLLVSSLAVAALTGIAGGIASASDAGVAPAAPPPTVPGLDIFADMGLTPEQTECLLTNISSVDTNDMGATMDLMTECGITMEQLLQMGSASTETLPAEESAPVASAPPPPAEFDAATAGSVLGLLGLDQAALDCLVVEANASAPADDAAAEAVFTTCAVGPLQILDAILALDAAAGGVVASDGTVPEEEEEAPATTVAGSPPVTSGNAMVDALLTELAAEGIDLSPEQGQCLLENIDIAQFDPNDVTALVGIFETCGIDIADLITGG
jgi:hypothetical protein